VTGYEINTLRPDGTVKDNVRIEPDQAYPISKLRNQLEKFYEGLHFGKITSVIIERIPGGTKDG